MGAIHEPPSETSDSEEADMVECDSKTSMGTQASDGSKT